VKELEEFKHQKPIMSGKQSASMTTSIRRDVCTSQRMGGVREEKSNIVKGLGVELHSYEADSCIAKTNATLLEWGEVWQCQIEDMYWFS